MTLPPKRRARARGELPIPPLEMRELVGRTDPADFDNPDGAYVYPYLDPENYESVFDFGCGCGRIARQLIQQRDRPRSYVGVDLHAGMIRWCHENLEPRAPGFSFVHHDVYNPGLNPDGSKPDVAPLPANDGAVTLVNAISVFTHLTEAQAGFYLREAARILHPDGVFQSTWFLFDKTAFPMMQEFQNALYINLTDPTNAVIYDVRWLQRLASAEGLTIHRVMPPTIRGFHWTLVMSHAARGLPAAEFPDDVAEAGTMPPPIPAREAHTIGLP